MDYLKLVKVTRVAAASGALVFALGAGGAFASIDLSGSSDTTGPSSVNTNHWDIDNNSVVTVANVANASNGLSLSAGSGSNTVDHNTEVGDILTGDVSGDISVDNSLNTGEVEFGMVDPSDISLDFANSITGPNSSNTNSADVDMNKTVNVVNTASIVNGVNLAADSGHNGISNNTVVGDMSTGDVNFDLSSSNTANANAGSINLGAMNAPDVSADFSNGKTGPNSENANTVDLDANTTVNVTNQGVVTNSAALNADTGHNAVGNNTVVGDVHTGSVDISYDVTNSVN
jgi:hypothetical protein